MKKVIGIFMMMVFMVIFVTTAFAVDYEEVKSFCLEHYYLNKFVPANESDRYNIVDDEAYGIGGFEDTIRTWDEFIEWYYPEYLAPNWPEFAEDVDVEFYHVIQNSENYDYVIVELKLNNGKLMSDYVSGEPDVTRISGIVPCKK